MSKELSKRQFLPLSTRMIFLHHRVRLYDSKNAGFRREDTERPRTLLGAWGCVLLIVALAAILAGAFHA